MALTLVPRTLAKQRLAEAGLWGASILPKARQNKETLKIAMTEKLPTYSAFWSYYLQEHSKAATRGWHYLGTLLVLVCGGLGLAVNPWWFLAMPFSGYGFAWASHFFIENNKPSTFTYPAWSLVSDFRMFGLWLTVRLEPHLKNAGVNL